MKEKYTCEKCDKSYLLRSERIDFLLEINNGKKLCKFCTSLEKKKKLRKHNPQIIKFLEEKTHSDNPKVTIECKFCLKEFTTNWEHRHREFCSKGCASSYSKKFSVKKQSKCAICNEKFFHYGNRIVCGEVCLSRYMSKIRMGDSNPAFKKDKNIYFNCKHCNKKFSYQKGGNRKERQFCTIECWQKYQKNKPKSQIIKKIGHNKYKGYSQKIRRDILKRDKYCILCANKNRLEVHHINYNTNDQDLQNLVTLCQRCHRMIKGNHYFWQSLFTSLKSNSKIVKKGWGLEVHFVNSNEYCLKYLIFWKNKKFSVHYHAENGKKEMFYCLVGKFECLISKGEDYREFLIKAGDKIEIEPGVIHQVSALKNSILIEVSTKDFPEDSYRIIKGD